MRLPLTLVPDVPSNVPIDFQCWILDETATFGLSASNGLEGVTS